MQSWRGSDWDKSEDDSTFIIQLEPKGKDVILEAFHINLPDKQAKDIDGGWYTFYWEPWKKYLAGKPIDKYPEM